MTLRRSRYERTYDYIRYFFTRYRSSITRTRISQTRVSACIWRAYVTDSVRRKGTRLEGKLRGLVPFTGVRGDYAPSLHRILLLSPTRWRPSLRVLSPGSQPTPGLTLLLLAHTHLDDSIGISGRESSTKQHRTTSDTSREFVKKISPYTKIFAEKESTSANNVAILRMPVRVTTIRRIRRCRRTTALFL